MTIRTRPSATGRQKLVVHKDHKKRLLVEDQILDSQQRMGRIDRFEGRGVHSNHLARDGIYARLHAHDLGRWRVDQGLSWNCNKTVVKDIECAVKKVTTLSGSAS
jgi:hypothetical protein